MAYIPCGHFSLLMMNEVQTTAQTDLGASLDKFEAADLVRAAALAQDFSLVGITHAKISDHEDVVRQWIADGKHGEMHYLESNLEKRLDPSVLVEGAKSVICVADAYTDDFHINEDDASSSAVARENIDQSSGRPHGKIAGYAWGDDYHKVMKKRLYALADHLRQRFGENEEFKCTVDTAPILEKENSSRSGIGWVGKHTLVIHPKYGSYFLLGTIVTTLDLATDEDQNYPLSTVAPKDHCGTCTRCIDACPTDAITPYSVDGALCISYLTLEHRSLIDESLHEPMGDWIAGCDICQQVCPFNQSDYRTQLPIHPAYTPRPPAPQLPLEEILDWTAEDRSRIFTKSALKRIKLDMLKRNTLIALGNYLLENEDARLTKRLIDIASNADEPDLVRQTAEQVVKRLSQVP